MTEPAGDEAVEYAEPARSYRSLWITLLVFLAAVGADAALSGRGALDHLPGWVVFGGVVLGMHALFVHAARATHSLSVTESRVSIGDEWLERADITGLAPEGDGSVERPVLGWPNTRPRQIKNVVVRVGEDQDVAVPTRYPDRLRAALGLGTAPVRELVDEGIRTADPDEFGIIAQIDERADAVFRVAGYELPRIPYDVAGLHDAAAVFVIGRPPVAFAQLDVLDDVAHLTALAVVPSAMRQGLGGRLLEHAAGWARDAGYDAITLTTFADVPWNAPYYAARGFREVPAASAALAGVRAHEQALGLDRVGRRVVMRRELA